MTSVFAALHHACADLGTRLFTISLIRDNVARRVYTSDQSAYPRSGEKPVADDAWRAQVLTRGTPFVANTAAEFAPYFSDHAQIVALGCRSCANLPVTDAHRTVVATVNLLADEGHFTAERMRHYARLLAQHKGPLMHDLACHPDE